MTVTKVELVKTSTEVVYKEDGKILIQPKHYKVSVFQNTYDNGKIEQYECREQVPARW